MVKSNGSIYLTLPDTDASFFEYLHTQYHDRYLPISCCSPYNNDTNNLSLKGQVALNYSSECILKLLIRGSIAKRVDRTEIERLYVGLSCSRCTVDSVDNVDMLGKSTLCINCISNYPAGTRQNLHQVIEESNQQMLTCSRSRGSMRACICGC